MCIRDRDVIRRNKLRFDPRLKINEDVLFNLQYLRFLLFLQKNSAIYCLAGVYYNQNDMLAGSLRSEEHTSELQSQR